MARSKRFSAVANGAKRTLGVRELWVNLGDDGLREAAYRGG